MAEQKTVRFGLLGAGLVAPFHAKGIQAAPGCELAAVADLDADRVKKLAAQYGCKAMGSLDELTAAADIDVIDVIIPNQLHADATVAAAKAGKHVLVEKPPAMSLADTDRMIAACRDAGVKLGVVLNCRVRQAIQAIKRAIDEGRFGRLLQADATMKWFRPTEYYLGDQWRTVQRNGAGVTIQQAFHYIDLLVYLVGPVKGVHARMTNLAHPKVRIEDSTLSFLDFECGAQGVLVASTALWPGTDLRIEINGENGTAIMVGERMETWKFRDDRPEDEEVRGLGRGAVATGAGGAADFDFADHQTVIEGMARAVREDTDPLITADSARPTLEAALAMYQSANTGRPVQLPLTDESAVWG